MIFSDWVKTNLNWAPVAHAYNTSSLEIKKIVV
jgi:hypothetical protein